MDRLDRLEKLRSEEKYGGQTTREILRGIPGAIGRTFSPNRGPSATETPESYRRYEQRRNQLDREIGREKTYRDFPYLRPRAKKTRRSRSR